MPPQWGHPGANAGHRPAHGISTHAPAMGASASGRTPFRRSEDFNPCPRNGGITRLIERMGGDENISTHAPAMGASLLHPWKLLVCW